MFLDAFNSRVFWISIIIVVIFNTSLYSSTAQEICLTRLEKVDCSDKEKSELLYVCESRSSENCSCVFDNPIRSEIGWFKTCQFKSSLNVRKKKVRKRQVLDQNLCGTIDPPRPGKVSCYLSRTDIKCVGTCDTDHEFIDGMHEKTFMCLYTDGVWLPAAEFPTCKPKCNPPCENGGTCQSANFCVCTNDYRGNICQYPINLCSISKNKLASYWKCNHTSSETTCDISCHAPDTPDVASDVRRYNCSIDGEWDPQLPPCVQVPDCNEPKPIANGYWTLLVGHTLTTGSRIVYACEDGYILQGEKIVECARNGSWASKPPVCLPLNVCQDPGDILHGQRNVSTFGFYEGSTIVFKCLENFKLLGNPIIRCLNNGQWSSTKPECVPHENIPASCYKPSAPKNSMVHVTFPSQHPLATIFNGNIPVSQLLYMSNYAGGKERDFTTLPDSIFVIGTRVQYKCKSRFYKLYGSEYQTCLSSLTWSGYQPACVPGCGRSDSPKTPFIVNGNSSRIGQWPWQVGLALKSSSGLHLLCGGVLVSEVWILTAAHCVTKKLSNMPMEPSNLLVFCGKYYRNFDKDDQYVQVKQVKQIIVHEEYDFIHFDVDIALVQLESAVELTTRVQPICLPTEDTTRENLRDGKRGIMPTAPHCPEFSRKDLLIFKNYGFTSITRNTAEKKVFPFLYTTENCFSHVGIYVFMTKVTGWGLNENGKFSEILKEAVLPVVSHDRCEEAYREGLRSVTITKNMFCAGYEYGQADTCNGDSGGPLMFAIGPANDVRWYLEGIVSWGSESGCGKSRRYSGFTKVGRFVPWINMYI